MARREYQRLAFSATPFPADTMLVLKTSSEGVISVSSPKDEEYGEGEGEGEARPEGRSLSPLKGAASGSHVGEDHRRALAWGGVLAWGVCERCACELCEWDTCWCVWKVCERGTDSARDEQ